MGVTEATGPVKHAVINENTASSNEIVALVAARKIRVLSFVISNNDAAASVIVTWEDEDGNDIIGPLAIPAETTLEVHYNPTGHGDTPLAKGLHLLSDGTEQLGGSVAYQEIK